MVVILHLSRMLGIIVGVGLGAVIILFGSAAAGIIIGVALGASVGCLAGLLPYEIARHTIQLSLRWSKTGRLKERLTTEHGLAHLIILELVRRGESVEQFRGYAQSLLQSDSGYRRRLGRNLQRSWFPDLPS